MAVFATTFSLSLMECSVAILFILITGLIFFIGKVLNSSESDAICQPDVTEERNNRPYTVAIFLKNNISGLPA